MLLIHGDQNLEVQQQLIFSIKNKAGRASQQSTKMKQNHRPTKAPRYFISVVTPTLLYFFEDQKPFLLACQVAGIG